MKCKGVKLCFVLQAAVRLYYKKIRRLGEKRHKQEPAINWCLNTEMFREMPSASRGGSLI